MRYLVGMDEAGYGPNLGPLVIAATLWEWPGDGCRSDEVDLYETLRDVVCREPTDDRVAIADSKALYDRSTGIAPLERSVLAAFGAMGERVTSVRQLFKLSTATETGRLDRLPWYVGFDDPLPFNADPDEVNRFAGQLAGGCDRRGLRLGRIRARLVFPNEFNRLVDRHGNKAAALSFVTLQLLSNILEERGFCRAGQADRHFFVVCDKHGGRSRYGPLLQAAFPRSLVEIRGEGRAESRYEFGPPGDRVDVRFRRGGESFLPAALASMTAKYLREISMRSFNRYWQQQVPGIRPTAGYPVDAKRFKREIAARQTELGIDDRLLWRNR